MNKVLGLLFISSSVFSMQLDTIKSNDKRQIHPSHIFTPERLGKLELYHSKKGFTVKKDDEKLVVKKYFTDKVLHDITKNQLKSFLDAGYISINQMNDGEYSLQAKGRINGGGPMLGTAAYWVTKSVCYAVGFAAIGGTVVTTGGAAVGLATYGVASAGGIALTGAAVTTTTAAAIGTTTGVVVGTATAGATLATGAGLAGGAIGIASATGATVAGVTLVEAATLTTAAAVTTTGSVAATIAAVESVSLAIGTFFGMLPTP